MIGEIVRDWVTREHWSLASAKSLVCYAERYDHYGAGGVW